MSELISHCPLDPGNLPFYFLPLSVWLLWIIHISKIVRYLSFCDCLISLNIMSLRVIRVIASVRISFPGWIIFHCMYMLAFVYLSIHCWTLVSSSMWLLWIRIAKHAKLSLWVAVTNGHRWQITNIYFSQFWGWDVQDQNASRSGSC